MNPVRSVRMSHRSTEIVAFLASYDICECEKRGIGPEHLCEVLLQISRPLLRAQAGIAYSGHFNTIKAPECNFTIELLNLIREEQQEYSASSSVIRGLYNHQAWPFYLDLD